jgi:START domain
LNIECFHCEALLRTSYLSVFSLCVRRSCVDYFSLGKEYIQVAKYIAGPGSSDHDLRPLHYIFPPKKKVQHNISMGCGGSTGRACSTFSMAEEPIEYDELEHFEREAAFTSDLRKNDNTLANGAASSHGTPPGDDDGGGGGGGGGRDGNSSSGGYLNSNRPKNLPPRDLKSLTLAEAIELTDQLHEEYVSWQATMSARGNPPKDVLVDLGVQVAKPAQERLSLSVDMDHVGDEELKALHKEYKTPTDAVLTLAVELPVFSNKNKERGRWNYAVQIGKLVGKVFLVIDTKIRPLLKSNFPAFIDIGKSLSKNKDGAPILRFLLYFGQTFKALDYLRMLRQLKLYISIAEAEIEAAVDAEEDDMKADDDEEHRTASEMLDDADAASAAAETEVEDESKQKVADEVSKDNTDDGDEEKIAVPQPSNPDGLKPLFVELPSREHMSLDALLQCRAEQKMVAKLHQFMLGHNFLDPSGVVSNTLSVLPQIKHLPTRVEFHDWSQFAALQQADFDATQMASQLALLPSQRLSDLCVAGFQMASATDSSSLENLTQLNQMYESLVAQCCDCFCGFDGTYRVMALSGNTHLRIGIKGISPFEIFPDIKSIYAILERRRAAAARRAKEAAALANLGAFEESEFDKFIDDATSKPAKPWTLVYPYSREIKDGIFVWMNEEEAGIPFVRVQGICPGVAAKECFDHFANRHVRLSWDRFIHDMTTVEKFPQHNADVTHTVYATAMGMAHRDFVEYRQTRVLPNDQGFVMMSRSVVHPQCLAENSENIRGTTLYSGYLFENIRSAVDGSIGTRVVGIIKQDLGGNIPDMLLSQLNKRMIAEWMKVYIETVILQSKTNKFFFD